MIALAHGGVDRVVGMGDWADGAVSGEFACASLKCRASRNARPFAPARWVMVVDLWATTPVSNADCGGEDQEHK